MIEEAPNEEITRRVEMRPDWEAHVRHHQRRVLMSVVALGLRLDRAEEICQRAWARLIEKFERGELESVELPGLVIAQARFFARDELRRLAKEQQHRSSVGDITILDDRDPERRFLAKEDLERALAAISACSPSAQRVFRAFYDDPRRPQQEIARELGISLQRVRQTLCEVRRRVREALESDHD
jgi:RNA polymerase sigma-70 factor (ECF subfamily)